MDRAQTSALAGTVIALSIALLAATTVLWQERQLGLRYVEGEQFARHQSVLSGSAPNPWRYRVLAEWIAAGFIKAAYVIQVPRPIAVGFLGLRFFQNALILLLAFMRWRKLTKVIFISSSAGFSPGAGFDAGAGAMAFDAFVRSTDPAVVTNAPLVADTPPLWAIAPPAVTASAPETVEALRTIAFASTSVTAFPVVTPTEAKSFPALLSVMLFAAPAANVAAPATERVPL